MVQQERRIPQILGKSPALVRKRNHKHEEEKERVRGSEQAVGNKSDVRVCSEAVVAEDGREVTRQVYVRGVHHRVTDFIAQVPGEEPFPPLPGALPRFFPYNPVTFSSSKRPRPSLLLPPPLHCAAPYRQRETMCFCSVSATAGASGDVRSPNYNDVTAFSIQRRSL